MNTTTVGDQGPETKDQGPAPELLEACKAAEFWLLAELDDPGSAKPEAILDVLRAAIAKAKGRTS